MEFKKLNARAIVLMSIAGILIVFSVISNLKSKAADVPENQIPTSPTPGVEEIPLTPGVEKVVNNLKTEDEDEAAQKEMKDQMEKDRNQQRQIKMLKMQLEQINLQLDNEKALTEINKLKKENAGYVKDSNAQDGSGHPSIRIIYIGGTDTGKEAILSIDGTSYSVKAKDRPMAGIEVLNVTDKSVEVHFSVPHELTTVINYIQDE